MKLAFLADLHLNTSTYGGINKDGVPFRMNDFMSAFSWSVSEILKIKPDCVFILGDIYDNPNPPNIARHFFYSQINKLVNSEISVHILVGNHDTCRYGHALQPINGIGWKGVYVYYSPSSFKLKNGDEVFIFPHSERVERKEVGMRDLFLEKAKEWGSKSKDLKGNGNKTFLLGHFPISGGFVSKDSLYKSEDDICLKDIDLVQASYSFFGDFHTSHKLDTNSMSMYVGSLERSTFADLNSPKGFVVYDEKPVEDPVLGEHICFVENPSTRPMILISGNDKEIKKKFDSLADRIKDSILKVHFEGSRSQYFSFEKTKESIKKSFYEGEGRHILFSSRVLDVEKQKMAETAQKEIKKLNKVEIEDIEQVVDKIVKNKKQEDLDKDSLGKLATEIIRSSNQKREVESKVSVSGAVKIHGVKGHNFQRFGEEKNIIEFDEGAAYFLSTGVNEIPQWQKEDFNRKGKVFLEQILSDPSKKIFSIVGMTNGDFQMSNGSGKSTIIEMISYALYEKRAREYVHKAGDREKGKSTISIAREKNGAIDCDEAFVDLLFSVDKSLWLLRRGRKISGKDKSKHESILELFCITSEEFVYSEGSYSGHRGEDANKALSELIRMPFETFCNSLLFGQNDAGQFLIGTDKTRKDILMNILNLNVLNDYLEETRLRKKIIENDISSTNAQIEVLVEGSDEKLNALNDEFKEVDFEIKSLLSQQEEFEKKILEIDISKFSADVEKAKSAMDIYELEIKNKTKEMEKDFNHFNSILKKLIKDVQEKENSIKKDKELIARKKEERSGHEDFLKKYNEKEISKQKKLIASAKENRPKRKKQKEELQNKLNLIIEKFGNFDGKIKQKEEELDDLFSLKEKFGNGEEIKCPKCQQVVGAIHISSEILKLSDEIEEMKKEFSSLEKQKENVKKELFDVTNRLSNIEDFLGKESTILQNEQKTLFIRQKAEDLEIEIKAKQDSIENLSDSLLLVFEEKNNVEEEIKKIEKNKEKSLSPYFSKKENAEEEWMRKKEVFDKKRLELKNLETEKRDLSSSCSKKTSLKDKIKTKIEILENSIKQAEEMKESLNEKYDLLKNLKILDWVFGQDGAQVFIIDKYMPLLNHYLQEFLNILSDGAIMASVITDGKKDGKVDIAISGDLSSSFDGVSGGENVKIRLALDMALGMLSLSRASGTIDSIYIDEAIAPVDVDSKDKIFALLDRLLESFRTIGIISHDPFLLEKVKNTIVVNKVNGLSTIEKQYYQTAQS